MRRIRWFAMVAAVLAIALVGVACGGDDPDTRGGGTTLSGDIRIDGSSTVGPLSEAAAEFFQTENPDVRVTVGISGTGGGFEKFCAGETDANDASRQIEADEEQLCADAGIEWVEIQVANDGLAVVVNPENDWADSLTVEQPGPAPRIPRVLDLSTFVLSNISRPLEPRAELGFLKPLIRRRFLDERALRYDPGLRLGEDYALYVRALMAGATFKIVGFHGYVAVERASSLSSRHRAADLDAIRAFDAACREQAGLDAAARQALAAHELATADKLALAQALEIRREKGIGPALRFLSQQPRSIRYVASEIFRARAARFRRRLLGETTGAAETGARLLIGQKAIA